MHHRPATAVGIVTVVLTLLGWASVPLFLRHFADHIDLWTSNGVRYGFSAMLWLPVLVVAAMSRGLPKGLWRAAIVPSIVNAAGQVCFTWAHYRIDPGLLTFGLRTQLLFVAIGAWILFPRERAMIRTPGYLVGAFLLIVGSAAVLALDQGGESTRAVDPQPIAGTRGFVANHAIGVALAVASGLLFAAYGLAVRKFMDGINPVLAFAAICQYTAAGLIALMLILGENHGVGVVNLAGSQIAILLLSAVIGIAVGHVFYYISIARLGVAVTAGVLQLQPFIVALFSLALFSERLGFWQWCGGCIAVGGAMAMLAVQWRTSRHAYTVRETNVDAGTTVAEGESGS